MTKNFDQKELYGIFVDTVMNSTDEELSRIKNKAYEEIVDEAGNVIDEVEAGNMTIVYADADTEKGYLTYFVTYINDEEMTVYNLEMNMLVARFQRNAETGSWSNIEMAEFNDETIFITDIIDGVVKRLMNLLKKSE